MNIGKLRLKVRIDSPNNVSDGVGGEVTIWTPLATVWAEMLPLAGNKIEEAGLITIGQQAYKMHIRYRSDVTTACRMVWLDGDRTTDLRIDAIADPDGRRRYLRVNVTAGVPT